MNGRAKRFVSWWTACAGSSAVVWASFSACSSGSTVAADAGNPTEAATGDAPSGTACSIDSGAPSGPHLEGLGVERTGTSASMLVPDFAPDVSDYYIRCSAGKNPLSVSVEASTGAEAVLSVETPAKPKSRLAKIGGATKGHPASVVLEENQALVVSLQDGMAENEYWVRCLPHDVSPMSWVTHGCGRPTPGYYLVGDIATPAGGTAYALLLDTHGVPIWYVRSTPDDGIYDFDQVFPGTLSFIDWAKSSGWQIHALDPPSVRTYKPAEFWLNPHDLRPLPDGRMVEFGDGLEQVDLTGFDVPLSDGGLEKFGPNSMSLACNLVEFDATGKVYWTWIGTDHLDPVKDNELRTLESANMVLTPDPYHGNSIDVDPANSNLLVSMRNASTIVYVDRKTGRIEWKMGGAEYNKDDAQFVSTSPEDTFHLQHDVRLQPGWSATCGGQISVFDDELPGQVARAVVYDVTLKGKKSNGDSCGTPGARIVWQYASANNTSGAGSFRIAPDGSRVIGWGMGANAGHLFTELDPQGHPLVDMYFTNQSPSYRAVKVPIGALDANTLRMSGDIGQP